MRIFFIAFCLCFISCKKGSSDFTIKGIITDATFNSVLTNASVSLYQIPAGGSKKELISSTTLDLNGSYSFTFKRDKMDKYILNISKNNYFDLEETIHFSSLTIENDNVRNYSTTAKSWVKLRFYNNNPNQFDELKFTKQQGKSSCSECCLSTEQYLYGAIDTSIYCINDGNTIYSYLYEVSGTTNLGVKSLETTAFDTTEIYLVY